MAEKKELKPVVPVKYDSENGHISRDDFMAKRRREKELAAKMKAFEEQAKAEILSEESVKADTQPQAAPVETKTKKAKSK